MIDIETLGTGCNSVIVSIGAIQFDIETGETQREYYKRIDIDSCLKHGMHVSGATIRWWMNLQEESRLELALGGEDISMVLQDFSSFIKDLGDDAKVWSNGLRFDVALLNDAYNKIGIDVPWNFRNERDVRTLVSFAPGIKNDTVSSWDPTNLHHALEDCKLQIKYCSEIYRKIKISKWKN